LKFKIKKKRKIIIAEMLLLYNMKNIFELDHAEAQSEPRPKKPQLKYG